MTTQTPETPATPETPKKPRRYKWIVGGLIVSLAFNLFTIGALVAGGRGYASHYHEMRQIVRVMPREARREIRAKMRARRGEFRALRRSMREESIDSLRALAGPLSQESFNRAEAERILERAQKSIVTQSEDLIRSSWRDALDVIEKMPPQERKEIANKLEEALSLILRDEDRILLTTGDGRGFLAMPMHYGVEIPMPYGGMDIPLGQGAHAISGGF